MAFKIVVESTNFDGSFMTAYATFIDTSMNATVETLVPFAFHILLDMGYDFSTENINSLIQTAVLAYATTQSYTPITASDITWSAPNMIAPTVLASLKNGVTKSFGSASRSLNSAFQISSTRDSLVGYSVDIATTISLTTGQSGTVFLEYADQSGFTTGVTEVARFVNGNAGTLTLGLNLTQTNTAQLGGMIPAGKYARLRTANNTGTPTFTYRSGQEVLV